MAVSPAQNRKHHARKRPVKQTLKVEMGVYVNEDFSLRPARYAVPFRATQ
jgi:hypothetical protein